MNSSLLPSLTWSIISSMFFDALWFFQMLPVILVWCFTTLSVYYFIWWGVLLNSFVRSLQYPEYIDAYLRLAYIAKARNNIQLSIELVVNLLLLQHPCFYFLVIMYKHFYIMTSFHRFTMLWRWMTSAPMRCLCLVSWSWKMMTGLRQKKPSGLLVMQLMGRIPMLLFLWFVYCSPCMLLLSSYFIVLLFFFLSFL